MELFPLFIISNKTFCPYNTYIQIHMYVPMYVKAKHMQYTRILYTTIEYMYDFRRYKIHVHTNTLLMVGATVGVIKITLYKPT